MKRLVVPGLFTCLLILSGCGSNVTSQNPPTKPNQNIGASLGLKLSGMNSTTPDQASALKNRDLRKPVFGPQKNGTLNKQGETGNCANDYVVGNQGTVSIHSIGGGVYVWSVTMDDPSLWLTYSYSEYINGRYSSGDTVSYEPYESIAAEGGSTIDIEIQAYGLGISFGGISCITPINN